MLRPIMLMFLAGTFLGTSAIYAAENSDKQATKDAARQLCVTEVRKRYENAEVSSQRAKRKKIGKVRGYAFRIKTNKSKSLVCLASSNGETIFYSGNL